MKITPEEICIDKIWEVFNRSNPKTELLLSVNSLDYIENILKEYAQAKLEEHKKSIYNQTVDIR